MTSGSVEVSRYLKQLILPVLCDRLRAGQQRGELLFAHWLECFGSLERLVQNLRLVDSRNDYAGREVQRVMQSFGSRYSR